MVVDICTNIGVVGLASVSIPFALDNQSYFLIGYGLVISSIFWYIGLRVAKYIDE
jgi:hypothetical protein